MIEEHTVYLEIFVVTTFLVKIVCKIFFVGQWYPQKFIYTKKVLHGYNFTLSLVIIFFTRTHVLSIMYAMAAAIEHVHRRACCVHGYNVYREIWEATVGEILQVCIPLTPLESFREKRSDAADFGTMYFLYIPRCFSLLVAFALLDWLVL